MKFSPQEIAQKSLEHLQFVVAIDSSSDENSDTIPSTPGQAHLARELAKFFEHLGATTTLDPQANLVAKLPSRGAKRDHEPLALMVHLDTARGTAPLDTLTIHRHWDGRPLSYARNPELQVSVQNYPSLVQYVGQDVVHGMGDAPFGLDDKLGLTHLMTLAWLLHHHPDVDHPPLLIVARPDEEIGRMEALLGLAEGLAKANVRNGYTIDGLDPFEINIENFNASHANLFFASKPVDASPNVAMVALGGVNTHGATAKAEGHRPATRFAAEILAELAARDVDAKLVWFVCDELRDCDAHAYFVFDDPEHLGEIFEVTEAVVAPHIPRGASFEVSEVETAPGFDAAAHEAIAFVGQFLGSDPGFTLSAEESDGFDGYSQPYRVLPTAGGFQLDIRLRDFDRLALTKREDHVRTLAGDHLVGVTQQYINMGPKLAERPELVEWAIQAAKNMGVEPLRQPIRGGTGVDPFLDKGIAVANLGTGYFAPESEKEFTTMQTMAAHAQWLFELVQL
ncbi:MAG: M20/M25/M40 family metallo-hydrolase [bacterium]